MGSKHFRNKLQQLHTGYLMPVTGREGEFKPDTSATDAEPHYGFGNIKARRNTQLRRSLFSMMPPVIHSHIT